MKLRGWIRLLLLCAGIALAAGVLPVRIAPAGMPFVEVTVLFFNDIHGHLRPFAVPAENGKQEVGGIARVAALVESIRAENSRKGARTVLLVAGDILLGTPVSTVFKGRAEVDCLNAMGVDAMTVGSHEFDFGYRNFTDLKNLARFPFLSANVVRKDSGERICEPWVSFRLTQDVSLSVIGATTRDLLVTTLPENVKDLDVLDPVQAVGDAFRRLRDRGPVILLSHSRYRSDRAIAEAVPGLAAIIGGHDQILMSPYRKVGTVPVFQAFEKCRYLGRLDLEVDPASGKTRLAASSYLPVTPDIVPAPEIEAIVGHYHARMDEKFTEVIGESRAFLDGERDRVRYAETALGNFVTDVMREYSGADIALINSGSLRASIAAGPVTREDVFAAVPFANEIVLLDLTGRELVEVLTRSVRGTREQEDGGFLQVSGIRFTVRGHAVEKVRWASSDRPVDPDRTCRVAVTDFMASGGDGYGMLVSRPAENTRLPLRELILEAIGARGTVAARVEGRIVRVPNRAK